MPRMQQALHPRCTVSCRIAENQAAVMAKTIRAAIAQVDLPRPQKQALLAASAEHLRALALGPDEIIEGSAVEVSA
jgi:hypothetical protein